MFCSIHSLTQFTFRDLKPKMLPCPVCPSLKLGNKFVIVRWYELSSPLLWRVWTFFSRHYREQPVGQTRRRSWAEENNSSFRTSPGYSEFITQKFRVRWTALRSWLTFSLLYWRFLCMTSTRSIARLIFFSSPTSVWKNPCVRKS